MVCPEGHHNAAGARSCATCGRAVPVPRRQVVPGRLTVELDDEAAPSPPPPPAPTPPRVQVEVPAHVVEVPLSATSTGERWPLAPEWTAPARSVPPPPAERARPAEPAAPASRGTGPVDARSTPLPSTPPARPAAPASPPSRSARPSAAPVDDDGGPAAPGHTPEPARPAAPARASSDRPAASPPASLSFNRPVTSDAPLELEAVRGVRGALTWRAERLGVATDAAGRGLVLPRGEEVQARLSYIGAAWGGTGAPAEPTGPEVDPRLGPLFEGGGEVVVSDRRLVGVSRIGTDPAGEVGVAAGRLVFWALPLVAVDEVGLAGRTGPNGRPGRGLDVWSFGALPSLLRLETLGWADRGGQHWSEPTRVALQAIVGAACDRRLGGIAPADRAGVFTVPAATPAWDASSSFDITSELG